MGDVTINSLSGKLKKVSPSEDNYAGLLLSGVAATGIVLGTVYELNKLADAEALGLDATYDTANTVLVHEHISEFFRMCPEGKLFIMIVAQTITLTQMADKTLAYAAKLLRDPLCGGKIGYLGIGRNPASGYAPVITGGLDNDVALNTLGVYTGAVIKAQALAAEEKSLHRPVIIIIEGKSFNGTASAAINLADAAVASPQVAVVIGADLAVSGLNAAFNSYAAVGTALGMRAHRKVSENIGWVADGNIQSGADGKFLNSGLSSNLPIIASNYTDADLKTLHDKGFLVIRRYAGAPGVYFYGDRTCVIATDDFSTLANNAVMNKAIRKAYLRLLPNINSNIKVDPANGRLAPSICAYFEEEAKIELKQIVTDGEASAVDAYMNPNQDVLGTSLLAMDIVITPVGNAGQITVSMYFANPFN